MTIDEFVDITNYTTFKLGPTARYFCVVTTNDELTTAILFAKKTGIPFFILGGGSNTIFKDKGYSGFIIKNEIKGFTTINEDSESVTIEIGSGENWDSIVKKTVELGFSGIEAMSAIPGSVGGTPIQNVGAYGQEIKDTLVSVEVYDYKEDVFTILTNEECMFSYRDSIFKKEQRYIVTSVRLLLSKKTPIIPNYKGVRNHFEEKGIDTPTLLQIREAIIEIRKNKLPDPVLVPSVGSFFKNPIVNSDVVNKIKEKYPDPVVFEIGNNEYKIGAGWLIDTLGFKGKSFGNLSLYEHNALVVVNNGKATFEELEELIAFIQNKVKEETGIFLETEPIFV